MRSPAAVFFAYSTSDVSEAVKCAAAWGVRVSPAAGRHGYQGAAVRGGFLVIDVSNCTQVGEDLENYVQAFWGGGDAPV